MCFWSEKVSLFLFLQGNICSSKWLEYVNSSLFCTGNFLIQLKTLSTSKILLLKAYKASKLKQCKVRDQDSVDLSLTFHIVLQLGSNFCVFHILTQQEKRLFGPQRILIQENSSFQPTPEWRMKLFSLLFINFFQSPWALVLSEELVMSNQVCTWLTKHYLTHEDKPALLHISSVRSLLCTSCSPFLPSTSVNASNYIAMVALLVSASLDVSNIPSTQYLYHVLKNNSCHSHFLCHWIQPELGAPLHRHSMLSKTAASPAFPP